MSQRLRSLDKVNGLLTGYLQSANSGAIKADECAAIQEIAQRPLADLEVKTINRVAQATDLSLGERQSFIKRENVAFSTMMTTSIQVTNKCKALFDKVSVVEPYSSIVITTSQPEWWQKTELPLNLDK